MIGLSVCTCMQRHTEHMATSFITFTRTSTYTHAHMHTHAHTCTHMHTHAHCTHMHTCVYKYRGGQSTRGNWPRPSMTIPSSPKTISSIFGYHPIVSLS